MIRFRSFAGKWEGLRLGDLFSSSRAKGFEGLLTLSVTLDRGLVNRDDLVRKQETNLTEEEHLLVRSGDIAYNMMRMWQGAFGRSVTDGIVSPAYVVLRGKKDVDTRYFEFAFRRSRSIYLFWAYSYGITNDRLRLYANDFLRIPFSAPTLPEQRKIAEFLTAVDGRIAQLSQKKALLEDYKKGVMQQLFTQALRFKDDHGNDFPEWEEKKLDRLVKFSRGGALSKSEIEQSGTTPCIHYGELFTTYGEVIHAVKSRTHTTRGVKSKGGEILMPSSDVTPFGLATASALDESGVIIGGDINVLSPSGELNTHYLAFYLTHFKRQIVRLVTGAAVKHIYNKDLATLKIAIPSDHREQTKIADFICALDCKIESVSSQITHTQTFKKGLLQQMFV